MNNKPDTLPALEDDALPGWPTPEQFQADMAEAEADEAAGRVEDGTALLEGLRRMATELEAKVGRRGA